jgi:hypothetical protein
VGVDRHRGPLDADPTQPHPPGADLQFPAVWTLILVSVELADTRTAHSSTPLQSPTRDRSTADKRPLVHRNADVVTSVSRPWLTTRVTQQVVPPTLAGAERLPLGERLVALLSRLCGGEQLLAPDPERHAVAP